MNRESIIAIIRIVVPAVCSVLGVLGWTVDGESITNVAIVLAGGIISLFTGYYNNNVTQAAQAGQEVIDAIKSGEELEPVVIEENLKGVEGEEVSDGD